MLAPGDELMRTTSIVDFPCVGAAGLPDPRIDGERPVADGNDLFGRLSSLRFAARQGQCLAGQDTGQRTRQCAPFAAQKPVLWRNIGPKLGHRMPDENKFRHRSDPGTSATGLGGEVVDPSLQNE
jgi:hypothetical protein